MPLEDRGVYYAQTHSDVTKQEVADLGGFACSRRRVFGVDPAVGTFNKDTNRAYSNGRKGVILYIIGTYLIHRNIMVQSELWV